MQEIKSLKSKLEPNFDQLLKNIDPVIAGILSKSIEDKELSIGDLTELFKTDGLELIALLIAADKLRQRQVGDIVTFVVNRNINFTNICTIMCGFCAFSRNINARDAYLLSIKEIVEKAKEAWKIGATEVCIQGGIHPKIDAEFYAQICKSIKAEIPDMHIHAFSPMEVYHAARKSGLEIEEVLVMLKESGLDSMPGTAAEILDDEVRKILCPNKINTDTWIKIVKTAHNLGIPTTSTIMYGHIDGPAHWAKHIAIIKDIQKETGGFTEFIPLGFVFPNTRIYREGRARAGPTLTENLKMHSVARLALGKYIKNIQASWVKLGPDLAKFCLEVGANDLGGTLMEENISRAAGCRTGQYMSVESIKRLITESGRIPAQRTTTYKILSVY